MRAKRGKATFSCAGSHAVQRMELEDSPVELFITADAGDLINAVENDGTVFTNWG